jgi:hypothetical protein
MSLLEPAPYHALHLPAASVRRAPTPRCGVSPACGVGAVRHDRSAASSGLSGLAGPQRVGVALDRRRRSDSTRPPSQQEGRQQVYRNRNRRR